MILAFSGGWLRMGDHHRKSWCGVARDNLGPSGCSRDPKPDGGAWRDSRALPIFPDIKGMGTERSATTPAFAAGQRASGDLRKARNAPPPSAKENATFCIVAL